MVVNEKRKKQVYKGLQECYDVEEMEVLKGVPSFLSLNINIGCDKDQSICHYGKST